MPDPGPPDHGPPYEKREDGIGVALGGIGCLAVAALGIYLLSRSCRSEASEYGLQRPSIQRSVDSEKPVYRSNRLERK